MLEPHLKGLGNWYELDCQEAEYWLFEITNVVDALDELNSLIIDYGATKSIKEFVFDESLLAGHLLFSPTQRRYNLATHDFVNLISRYGLTGFSFKLVWSSEYGAVSAKIKDYGRIRITGLEVG